MFKKILLGLLIYTQAFAGIVINPGSGSSLPSQTGNSGKYLTTDGTNASWSAIDISTASITGVLPRANGGTGLSAAGSSGNVLTSDGTDWVSSPPSSNLTVVSKAAADSPYTIADGVGLILCNSSAGAVTNNLPAATGSGRVIRLKFTDSGFANACNFTRNGTDTIQDGATGLTSTTVNTRGESVDIVDAASGVWQVINRDIPSLLPCATVTGRWTGANVTYTSFCRRERNYLNIEGKVVLTGAPTGAGNFFITLPNSLAMDTSNMNSTQFAAVEGFGESDNNSSTNDYPARAVYNDANSVLFLGHVTGSAAGASVTNDAGVATTFPITFGNADSFHFNFRVPIAGWN